jgi:hypothetical protein
MALSFWALPLVRPLAQQLERQARTKGKALRSIGVRPRGKPPPHTRRQAFFSNPDTSKQTHREEFVGITDSRFSRAEKCVEQVVLSSRVEKV